MSAESNTSPLPKRKKVQARMEEAHGYEFVICFNEKAQLTKIDHPSDLSLARVNNHLAVAMLFLAQKLAEEEAALKVEI